MVFRSFDVGKPVVEFHLFKLVVFLQAVGDFTGVKAIYDVHIELRRLPALEADPDPELEPLTAAAAASPDPVCFARVESVARIVEALESCSHNGFPVLHTSPTGVK